MSGSCIIKSNQFVGLFIRKCESLGSDDKKVLRGLIMPNFIISSIIKNDDFIALNEFE